MTAPNILVYANGAHVATLHEWQRLRGLNNTDGFEGTVWWLKELVWTHRGVVRQLQGEAVMDTLGPAVTLLDARHRPAWHPRPGADDICIVTVRHNPQGLSALQIFQLARANGI